ncbi:probable methyltransferase-like protein 24 [Macrobrachium rosenbergii]|uniref:probable methyltransferase-like protein 24 n=1 Tax=Macrobrachium rosenbergii TaxID=79674 RepID=UPI0034D5EFE9
MRPVKKIFYGLPVSVFFVSLYSFSRGGNFFGEAKDGFPHTLASDSSASAMIHITDETLERGSIIVEHQPLQTRKSRVFFASGTQIKPVQYVNRTLPNPARLYKEANPLWVSWGPRLREVRDYFRYLRTPQVNCRKLKRMGGTVQCGRSGDGEGMDGHKYICMEPAFMLTQNQGDVRECLTLSFGTHFETSFDEAMADLPCEVHMFDVLDYRPLLAAENPYVYFHQEGIAAERRIDVYSNTNATAQMFTLRDHVSRLNLTNRLIHVLKVDIENSEWEVFKNIANDPIFNAVGQVALEVHTLDLVKNLNKSWSKTLPKEKWLQVIQDKFDVLRAIEARGFRRVLYWDNYQKDYPYFDDSGVRYETSGEILYVNTNWYDPAFRRRLADQGYKFRDALERQ